jgi:hypothetical protein
MKNSILCLMVAVVTLGCIKEGPVTASAVRNRFQFSGKIIQQGTSLAVPAGMCTVQLVRNLVYFKDVLAESVTDQQGYYTLNFNTNSSHTDYFMEVKLPELNVQGSYWPYLAPIPVQPGVGQKLDIAVPTYAILLAQFRNRGAENVTNLVFNIDNLVIPIPLHSPADRYFTLKGNATTTLSCTYSVNGEQNSETYSTYVAAYDTVVQLIEYGLP